MLLIIASFAAQGVIRKKLTGVNKYMPEIYSALFKSQYETSFASRNSGKDFPKFMTYFILTQFRGVEPLIQFIDKQSGRAVVTLDLVHEILSKRYKNKFDFVQAVFGGEDN